MSFLVGKRADAEYRAHLDSFIACLEILSAEGIDPATSSLEFIRSKGLSLRAELKNVRLNIVPDQEGYRIAPELLTPLPLIAPCDPPYDPEELTHLIEGYQGDFTDWLVSIGAVSYQQQELLSKVYGSDFADLTQEQRVKGLNETHATFFEQVVEHGLVTKEQKKLLTEMFKAPFDVLTKEQILEGLNKFKMTFAEQVNASAQNILGVYFKQEKIPYVDEKQKQIVANMCGRILRDIASLHQPSPDPSQESRDLVLKEFIEHVHACAIRVNEVVRDTYHKRILKQNISITLREAFHTHVVHPIFVDDYVEGVLCRDGDDNVRARKHYRDMITLACNWVPPNDDCAADLYNFSILHPKPAQEVMDRLFEAFLTRTVCDTFSSFN